MPTPEPAQSSHKALAVNVAGGVIVLVVSGVANVIGGLSVGEVLLYVVLPCVVVALAVALAYLMRSAKRQDREILDLANELVALQQTVAEIEAARPTGTVRHGKTESITPLGPF